MKIIYGTVEQNMIQLPEGLAWSDGTRVEIRVRLPNQISKNQRQAETLFKKRLLQMGILSHLPNPSSSMSEVFEPIVIPGPPLSEQIIAERR